MLGGAGMKTKKKMTNKEYIVAAMLLEYEYLPAYHMYDAYPYDKDRHKYIDPDTMEVIPLAELRKRLNRFRGG